MSARTVLSSYILGGFVATLLIIGVSDSPLGFLYAYALPHQFLQSIDESVFLHATGITTGNRSRKRDRLPILHAAPATNTTIVPRNVDALEPALRGGSGMPVRPKILEVKNKNLIANSTPLPLCGISVRKFSDSATVRSIGGCYV